MVSDDQEDGPDPNEIRRHAKRMYTAKEYRQVYGKLFDYRPSRPQLDFHNTIALEKMLRAGNQLGKTHCLAAQMAFDACAIYPDWYMGRRFDQASTTGRPFDFIGWAASTTSTMTRDNLQTKLLGDLSQKDGLGQGMIPLDYILGRPTMARGISNFADSVTLQREIGGKAAIRLKTYEMGRQAFQGESVEEIWLDEDVSRDEEEIYSECVARTTTTRGTIIVSMTPVLGRSPIRKRFDANPQRCITIRMKLRDAIGFAVREADIPDIIARTKASERATRLDGEDLEGSGAVFEIDPASFKVRIDPSTFPAHFRWLNAIDISHGGMSESSHPFAWVSAAYDPEKDIIFVVDALRLHKVLPAVHVAKIKDRPTWDARTTYGHDGAVAMPESGQEYRHMYKRLGLNMTPEWATFPHGGYDFKLGISWMEQRFAERTLLVADHLHDWWDEYAHYHYEDGEVVKIDDDLMSATRLIVMAIREARSLPSSAGPSYRGVVVAEVGGPPRNGNYRYRGGDDDGMYPGST